MTKNFQRETYNLKPLPLELAEQVLAHTREYVEFLKQSGASTHPDVRAIVFTCERSFAGLVGQIEAAKVRARGGGEDEMDAWERDGIKASSAPVPELTEVVSCHNRLCDKDPVTGVERHDRTCYKNNDELILETAKKFHPMTDGEQVSYFNILEDFVNKLKR
jgi:hypothetical protein